MRPKDQGNHALATCEEIGKKKLAIGAFLKKMTSNLVKSFFFQSCEIMEPSNPPPHTRTKT